MKFLMMINRLTTINNLIEQECTGTPKEFADRIGVSRSHLYYVIGELKDWGAPIQYSKHNRTFYYNGDFQMEIIFCIKMISNDECFKLLGRK